MGLNIPDAGKNVAKALDFGVSFLYTCAKRQAQVYRNDTVLCRFTYHMTYDM